MAADEKWYFSKESLDNSPSKGNGIDSYKELFFRQQAANFIQDMGQKLRVTQLCINTATVYMHRFYVFHSFTSFPWHSIAAAALFLSAKVEEQPRKLEHIIRVHNLCKNPRDTAFDVQSDRYKEQSQDLVFNENILLQTLGFDVAIDHPHAHVVRCCHLVRASKDLAQTSYFMASTSLHLTTMCLQYKPTVVACFCIHLACKWCNWEIPLSNEKKEWFSYVDPTVTAELLQQLTEEFLVIFERCPSRLKEKIMAIGEGANMCRTTSHVSSPFDSEPRKLHPPTDMKDPHHRLHHHEKVKQVAEDQHKHRSRPPHEGSSGSSQQQREREYREKKERERMAQHSGSKPPLPHPSGSTKQVNAPHPHHRPAVDPKLKQHSRPQSMGHPNVPGRSDHRDLLREATRDIGIRDSHRDSRSSEISEVNKDILTRDPQVRSEKETEKRAYPVAKTNMSDINNLQQIDSIGYNSEKRVDPTRPRASLDPKQAPHKHESRYEQKPQYKQENGVRKHQSWYDIKNIYDKNNAPLKQPMNPATSQKIKSPFAPDTSKSVPKSIKVEPYNGNNSNGGYGLSGIDDIVIKQEIKEEPFSSTTSKDPPYHMPVKKPSMFSPEKTPPRKQIHSAIKREPISLQNIPAAISPEDLHSEKRSRTVSNSSEPELRPVMKKIDQVEGFENILRDSTIGIKQHQVPDITHDNPTTIQQSTVTKETKSDTIPSMPSVSSSVPLSQPIVNGIETNPTLISNLLKEAPSVPHLPTITSAVHEESTAPVTEIKEKEHHHKDRKKKNKEKHKHKDKDKSREEKEKKKKYKDKDKDKHKSKNRDKEKHEELPAQPLKMTIISKNKIQPPPDISIGLKIKIPKDRIKTDVIGEPSSNQAPGIKIKIPKDVINLGNESKKRERDRGPPADAPPMKVSKSSSYNRQHGDKQNGRSSYSKVAQMGDGDTSMHRLAESKYINKGAST